MRHLSSFMQNEVVLALGWTLLHSLWQGLLLAVVTGTLLITTRRSSAQKRYELLTGLFLLFIAVTAITFTRELYLAIARPHFRPLANIARGRSVISTLIPFTETHIAVNRSWASRLKDYFNTHAYLLVTIWFIIFMARFIKLVAELAYIQRLKTYRTSEPPQAWKNRLEELKTKMYIHPYVQMLESGIVKVPVVMGILKPVILLPFGLLSQLPPDEIEAILLHELAHIRRRDYFVNLLQSLAETLFFFNPALMWLSSLIREERENCCDDIAISVTNNKTKYIDALISFQEFNIAKPSFSMGFPGKKNQLLNRVKRIIYKRNASLNIAEKSILTLSISVLILLSFVAARNIPVLKIRKRIAEHTAAVKSPIVPETIMLNTVSFQPRPKAEIVGAPDYTTRYQPVVHDTMIDTVPASSTPLRLSVTLQLDSASHFKSYSVNESNDGHTGSLIIEATQRNGTTLHMKRIQGSVLEFSINGKMIDPADYKNYQDIMFALEQPYLSKQAKKDRDHERSQILHDLDISKQELASLQKNTDVVLDGKGYTTKKDKYLMKADSIRLTVLGKQQELKEKLGNIEMDEEYEKRKGTLLSLKPIQLDTPKFKGRKPLTIETRPNLTKLKMTGRVELKNQAEVDALQKKEELLKKELFQTQSRLSLLKKKGPLKLPEVKDAFKDE